MTQSAWEQGRPIYRRLPVDAEQYQENDVCDWLTQPYDATLVAWKNILLNFEADFLDPATAREDALDWLAQLCGFTGEYWDPTWPVAAKRELISKSHLFIWPNKGTESLLRYLLAVFGINATIYRVGQFLVDINKVGDQIGGELLRYWILMPLTYLSNSKEWQLAERLNRLYMPCFCDSAVVYDRFYADFSRVGDPIF